MDTTHNVPYSLSVRYDTGGNGTKAVTVTSIRFVGEHEEGYQFSGLYPDSPEGIVPVETFLDLDEMDDIEHNLSSSVWKANKDSDIILAEHSERFGVGMQPLLVNEEIKFPEPFVDMTVKHLAFSALERMDTETYTATYTGGLYQGERLFPVEASIAVPIENMAFEDGEFEPFKETILELLEQTTWEIVVQKLITVGSYVKNEWDSAPLNGGDIEFYYRGHKVQSVRTALKSDLTGSYEITCAGDDDATHLLYANGDDCLHVDKQRSHNAWILSEQKKRELANTLAKHTVVSEQTATIRKSIDEQVNALRAQLEAEHTVLFAEETALADELEQGEKELKQAWVSEWELDGKPQDGKTSPDGVVSVSERPNLEFTSEKIVFQWLKANKHKAMIEETVVKSKMVTAWRNGSIDLPAGTRPVVTVFGTWVKEKLLSYADTPDSTLTETTDTE